MNLYKNTEWQEIKLNSDIKNIPKQWNKHYIGDIFSVVGGGTPPTTNKNFWNGDIPWLGPKEMSKEVSNYIGFGEKKITSLGAKKLGNKKVTKNSIIISTRAPVGYVKIALNDLYTNQGCHSLLINEKVNNIYMLNWLLKNRDTLERNATGTTFKELGSGKLKNIEFCLPSHQEQSAIASILSSQESIIQKTKNLIANIEKRNKFMMDELLSGRLRVKEENGQPVFYKNPDENWNEVKINGEDINIPKDWNSFKLKGNIEIKTGKKDANVAKKDGKYAFFTCGKQILKTDTYDFDCEAVLIAGNGDVGDTKYYQGKFDAYQRTYVLSNYRYDLKFLYIYMKKLFKDSIDALGSAMPYIKLGYLENFSVSQPKNLNERQLLLKVITSLNDEKQKYEQILEKEEKTFTFLLEELMSGRLRIKI